MLNRQEITFKADSESLRISMPELGFEVIGIEMQIPPIWSLSGIV